MNTKRKALAQLMFCQGCCCGRPDRGFPEVPVEKLKAIWKSEKLNQTVQLTISGCLGPCDLTNVTAVVDATSMIWLGGLKGDVVYDALIDWARACHAAKQVLPLPESFDVHRFERFPAPELLREGHDS